MWVSKIEVLLAQVPKMILNSKDGIPLSFSRTITNLTRTNYMKRKQRKNSRNE